MQNKIIVMAANYVGFELVKFIASSQHVFDCIVLDRKDTGHYNSRILECIQAMPDKPDIYYSDDLENKEIRIALQNNHYDIGFLLWWPYILKGEALQIPRRGWVNTHPALLPFGRGKHPYFWCLTENFPFGVTLHFIDEKIDSGRIAAQRKIDYNWLDTGETLYKRAQTEMISLFHETYNEILRGELPVSEVDIANGIYHNAKDIEKGSEIRLNESYRAETLLNMIRGRMFGNRGSTFFYSDGQRYTVSIKIEKAEEKEGF